MALSVGAIGAIYIGINTREQVRRGALRPKQPPAKAGEAHAARSRGAGLRGPLLDAARPARVGGHDGRAGAHVREDRLQAGHAEARRRRPRDRGGAPPRPGHPRALRAGEARRAPARRRQESGPHTRRRRPPRLGARPACTSPSTTSAGSPTPSCCPTSARAPARRSWAGACASSRAWACGSSA